MATGDPACNRRRASSLQGAVPGRRIGAALAETPCSRAPADVPNNSSFTCTVQGAYQECHSIIRETSYVASTYADLANWTGSSGTVTITPPTSLLYSLGKSSSTTTTTVTQNTIVAPFIQPRWKATDTPLDTSQSPSQPPPTDASPTSPDSPIPATDAPSPSPGLSTAAKAGVGVGAGLGSQLLLMAGGRCVGGDWGWSRVRMLLNTLLFRCAYSSWDPTALPSLPFPPTA